jgi:phage terminase small subunit
MGLTAKQQRFVAEYLVDLCATQAAVRAGYSEKTAYAIGHENLSKPDIAAAIAEAQAARAKRTELSQEWVTNNLREVAERCLQHQPVVRGGEETGEFTFNAVGATRALELLGRHLGMFKDRIEHTGANGADLLPREPRPHREVAKDLLAFVAKAALESAAAGPSNTEKGDNDDVRSS